MKAYINKDQIRNITANRDFDDCPQWIEVEVMEKPSFVTRLGKFLQ